MTRQPFSVWIRLARPFTLLPPVIGIFSGSLVAYGATRQSWPWLPVLLAAVAAAVLNAASNVLNQIYDLEIDRINKPLRPLPAGEVSMREAGWFCIALYVAALSLAAAVNLQTFVIYCIAAAATYVYSAPPLRTKESLFGANLTIAAIRGELLKVAGWSAVSSVLISWEPWMIGFIFFVFLLGATSTKDFADMEGDRAQNCRTLPVVLGPQRAARVLVPFFLAPWLLTAAGAYFAMLRGNHVFLLVLSAVMLVWGSIVARMIVHEPARLVSEGENHPAWRQMYWMMMSSHLGIAAAYLVPHA